MDKYLDYFSQCSCTASWGVNLSKNANTQWEGFAFADAFSFLAVAVWEFFYTFQWKARFPLRGDCYYFVVEWLDVKYFCLQTHNYRSWNVWNWPLSYIKWNFQMSVSFNNDSSFQCHFSPVIFPAVFIRMSFFNSLIVDGWGNTFEASSISKIGQDVFPEISLEIDLLIWHEFFSSFVDFAGVR